MFSRAGCRIAVAPRTIVERHVFYRRFNGGRVWMREGRHRVAGPIDCRDKGERVVKMDHDPASSGGKVPTHGHSENAVHAKRTSRPVR